MYKNKKNNNNYEENIDRSGGRAHLYLLYSKVYDERISSKNFFDKYELKFNKLKFNKIQYNDGFIRYIHPNNIDYIFELNVHNWYTKEEHESKFNIIDKEETKTKYINGSSPNKRLKLI